MYEKKTFKFCDHSLQISQRELEHSFENGILRALRRAILVTKTVYCDSIGKRNQHSWNSPKFQNIISNYNLKKSFTKILNADI